MQPLMPQVHFGGPNRPPRALRDLLQARVDASPPGSRIDWATYYFRDRALAEALVRAARRGVKVTLHVEGSPRHRGTNDPVLAILEADGLRGGLRVRRAPFGLPWLHPHLHSKIYVFSHPAPSALVGSFNPSGDEPEDSKIIAEIGDQDRGHNLLVDITDPVLVEALQRHIRTLSGLGHRFRGGRTVNAGETSLYFYPRLRTGVIDKEIASLRAGSRIRGTISHLKQGFLTLALMAAARRGVAVELLVHDTERRVPASTVKALDAAGITVRRYTRSDGLPLHAKFLLVEDGGRSTAWFGSFNFNPRSRYINKELLVRSSDPAIWRQLDARFKAIAAEL